MLKIKYEFAFNIKRLSHSFSKSKSYGYLPRNLYRNYIGSRKLFIVHLKFIIKLKVSMAKGKLSPVRSTYTIGWT
jgi:hypothetical protein